MDLGATHFSQVLHGHPSMAETVTIIRIRRSLRGPVVLFNPALRDGQDPRIDAWCLLVDSATKRQTVGGKFWPRLQDENPCNRLRRRAISQVSFRTRIENAGKPDDGLLQLPPYNRFVRLKISHINGYVCRVG
jgi:hypothetical protein